jgi:hypothetical protein
MVKTVSTKLRESGEKFPVEKFLGQASRRAASSGSGYAENRKYIGNVDHLARVAAGHNIFRRSPGSL